MTPWWTSHMGALVGGYGGAVIGVLCGAYGCALGMLAPKGRARRLMTAVHKSMIVFGVLALLAGLAALFLGQPYHVWYPLVLPGVVISVVMAGLLPVLNQRYDQAEQRKLDAEAIRRG